VLAVTIREECLHGPAKADLEDPDGLPGKAAQLGETAYPKRQAESRLELQTATERNDATSYIGAGRAAQEYSQAANIL